MTKHTHACFHGSSARDQHIRPVEGPRFTPINQRHQIGRNQAVSKKEACADGHAWTTTLTCWLRFLIPARSSLHAWVPITMWSLVRAGSSLSSLSLDILVLRMFILRFLPQRWITPTLAQPHTSPLSSSCTSSISVTTIYNFAGRRHV